MLTTLESGCFTEDVLLFSNKQKASMKSATTATSSTGNNKTEHARNTKMGFGSERLGVK